jgi:hypothetical protein
MLAFTQKPVQLVTTMSYFELSIVKFDRFQHLKKLNLAVNSTKSGRISQTVRQAGLAI